MLEAKRVFSVIFSLNFIFCSSIEFQIPIIGRAKNQGFLYLTLMNVSGGVMDVQKSRQNGVGGGQNGKKMLDKVHFANSSGSMGEEE